LPCPHVEAHLPFVAVQHVFKGEIYKIMSIITLEASSMADRNIDILLYDHSGGDIVLRSQDSYHIQVPSSYIVNSSPVLRKLIQNASVFSSNANADASMLMVELPESGEILHCLLTFIFPITHLIPSTPEKIMELLNVAQIYQTETALAHIRAIVAQQNLLPIDLEPALRCYALAQKYELRQEALQTARMIISKYPMTIEDLGDKLDIMPGASLYKLWNYHERVRATLVSDLAEFRRSFELEDSVNRVTITDLQCKELGSSEFLCWLDHYVESTVTLVTPHRFDFVELYTAMMRHCMDTAQKPSCKCASIPSQTIRKFWEALMSVVDGSYEKVIMVDMQSRLGRSIDPFTGKVSSISRAGA
jgi:hypothetical protein